MGRIIKPAGKNILGTINDRYKLTTHGSRAERRLLSVGGLGPVQAHGKPTPRGRGRLGR